MVNKNEGTKFLSKLLPILLSLGFLNACYDSIRDAKRWIRTCREGYEFTIDKECIPVKYKRENKVPDIQLKNYNERSLKVSFIEKLVNEVISYNKCKYKKEVTYPGCFKSPDYYTVEGKENEKVIGRELISIIGTYKPEKVIFEDNKYFWFDKENNMLKLKNFFYFPAFGSKIFTREYRSLESLLDKKQVTLSFNVDGFDVTKKVKVLELPEDRLIDYIKKNEIITIQLQVVDKDSHVEIKDYNIIIRHAPSKRTILNRMFRDNNLKEWIKYDIPYYISREDGKIHVTSYKLKGKLSEYELKLLKGSRYVLEIIRPGYKFATINIIPREKGTIFVELSEKESKVRIYKGF